MERWGFVTILGVYMELRVCYICKQEKELNLFASDKQKASGKASACKVCKNLRRREVRKHKMLHDEEFRKKRLEVRKRQTQNYKNNKQNEPKIPRVISQEEIERRKKLKKEKRKERLQTDSIYKLKDRLRKSIRESFKRRGKKKNNSTQSILGADMKIVFEHFESLFTNGMCWNNMGQWHIDHIIPLSTAITEEDVIRLCHYTNLQPLWAEDNLKKSNKLDWSPNIFLNENITYEIF